MNQLQKFTLGLALAFGLPWLFLIVIPWAHMRALEPVPYSEEDGDVEVSAYPPGLAGRVRAGHRVYAEQGCVYCHTQMVRPTYAGSDLWRPGWGGREEEGLQRETRMQDYLGESYAFLGVYRNGPDLSNVGWRIEDPAWHHRHLYNPRAENEWSIMPSFSYLYEKRPVEGQPSADALELPAEFAPEEGYEIVPTSEAKALVEYLMSLKKDYKVPVAVRKGRGGAAPDSGAGAGSGAGAQGDAG